MNFALKVYMMKAMNKIDIDDPDLIARVLAVLRAGGVVMHPTETCYGLAVDIRNEKALEKLYKVKRMPRDKPVSILVDGIGMASEYGLFNEIAEKLTFDYWPGPLSILVTRKRKLPSFLNEDEDFVSIRCSSLEFCEDMVAALGHPVTTTSANISGEPQLYEPIALEGVDLLVDAGKIDMVSPSTIVKVVDDRLEVLRQGSVLMEHMEECEY